VFRKKSLKLRRSRMSFFNIRILEYSNDARITFVELKSAKKENHMKTVFHTGEQNR
jgi:hypothetical protein